MSDFPPIPSNVGLLTGPQLLGHTLNCGFYGGLVVQCYLFYIGFPKDRVSSKLLVGTLLLLESLQVALSTVKMFTNFGPGYGDMRVLGTVGLFWFSSPTMTAIVSLIVQHFFAWRVYVLSNRKPWIPIPIILLSLMQCGAAISAGVNAHIVNSFAVLQQANFQRTTVWLSGTAACDVLITVLMLYFLLATRTSDFKATNSIITKFIKIAVETGALCATFAILDLVTFLAYKNNNIHVIFAMTLSKLYSNSLLVVLNARIHIAGGRDWTSGQNATTPDISLVVWNDPNQAAGGQTRTQGAINIAISRSVEHDASLGSDTGVDKSAYGSHLNLKD